MSWYTKPVGGDHGQHLVMDENSGETIAVVYNDCGDHHKVTAAPELLAALESFLRAPSIGSSGPGSITIEVQTFNLDAARAAIAKSKGQL